MNKKRIYIYFTNLTALQKTTIIICLTLGVVSFLLEFIRLFGNKMTLFTFIEKNLTFSTILQVINLHSLMIILSNITKRNTTDKHHKKETNNRFNRMYDKLNKIEERVNEVEKELIEVQKQLIK